MTADTAIDKVSDKVRAELAELELGVLTEGVTLASLMREGSSVSKQAYTWADRSGAICALSAAEAALRARK